MAHLLEEIALADEVGLHSFGIGEHHRPEYYDSAPPAIPGVAAPPRGGGSRPARRPPFGRSGARPLGAAPVPWRGAEAPPARAVPRRRRAGPPSLRAGAAPPPRSLRLGPAGDPGRRGRAH